jgi:hypothetical protein
MQHRMQEVALLTHNMSPKQIGQHVAVLGNMLEAAFDCFYRLQDIDAVPDPVERLDIHPGPADDPAVILALLVAQLRPVLFDLVEEVHVGPLRPVITIDRPSLAFLIKETVFLAPDASVTIVQGAVASPFASMPP